MSTYVVANRPRRDRLYIWFALGAALLLFIGFSRTYFLKGLFGTSQLPLCTTRSNTDVCILLLAGAELPSWHLFRHSC